MFLKRESYKDPWQIITARWCVERKTFTAGELRDFIVSLGISKTLAEQFYSETIYLPSGSKFSRKHENGVFFAPIELVSMVTDFDELKEARKNASQAWWFSLAAIILAALGAFFQYLSI